MQGAREFIPHFTYTHTLKNTKKKYNLDGDDRKEDGDIFYGCCGGGDRVIARGQCATSDLRRAGGELCTMLALIEGS